LDVDNIHFIIIFFHTTTTEKRKRKTMCRPTDVKTSAKDSEMIPKQEESVRKPSQSTISSGFLYGTISLALVVTAGSVVMGHYQSKRDAMGCDTMCVGSMTSARSTLTLLGSTIIGKSSDSRSLDDKLGGTRRAFLILGVVASAIELFVAVRANSISALWVSMVPSALFQQNFNVLKALFGEYHDSSATAAERAGKVGKLGMAVGLAFMAGPLLGSVLFKTYTQAAIFASLCLVGALIFILRLPRPIREDTNGDHEDSSVDVSKEKIETTAKAFISRFLPDVPAARTPPAVFIMVSRICMALSFHIFNTIWQVALRERFQFGPKDYGRYYAFIGFGFAVSQGYVAKILLKHFGTTDHGRSRLLLVCSCILGGGRFLAYQTDNIVVVYTLQGLIITALGVVNTIFTADTSKIASPDQLGGLFGVLGSVESLAGIIGPILGGSLAKIDPIHGPLMAVVLLYGTVFTLVLWGYERIIGRAKIDNVEKKVQ
jgi:MFS family permease